MLEVTVGHWPFSEWFQHLADQNSFGWPISLYIFNGMVINNLQNFLSSKKWLTNFWPLFLPLLLGPLVVTQHLCWLNSGPILMAMNLNDLSYVSCNGTSSSMLLVNNPVHVPYNPGGLYGTWCWIILWKKTVASLS